MVTTDSIDQLDGWLRGDFVRINTALEEKYFAERIDVIGGRPDVDELKKQLLRQGGPLMERLAGMPDLPADPHACYRLLGLVGHYLAACQRHEAFASAQGYGGTSPVDREGGRQAAWAVSTRIGNTLGVVPRLVFAHQSLFNDAIAGRYRTFTSLPDEDVFIRFNALGVLAYYRAAEALRGIANIGVSSVVAAYLFDEAEAALADVLRFNQDLAKQLNIERFFFNIRPYFKTYRVGDADYRGANAGDFSAINEIDVTLGLCSDGRSVLSRDRSREGALRASRRSAHTAISRPAAVAVSGVPRRARHAWRHTGVEVECGSIPRRLQGTRCCVCISPSAAGQGLRRGAVENRAQRAHGWSDLERSAAR